MKVKAQYVGPGTESGFWKTEDLTIGKIYDGELEDGLVHLHDDVNYLITRAVKGLAEDPCQEYFVIVE